MRHARPFLQTLLALGALLSLWSCGAGLITGAAASGGGSSSGEARAPELSLNPLIPLVPAANTTRTVVVTNALIAASARLRVRIELGAGGAGGVGADQRLPVASGQGGSTLITFTLDTEAIVAAVADPTVADLQGTLTVFVDDRPIAPPAPIVLARQPRAELVLDAGQTERFLSPLGERVHLRIAGLRATDASELSLFVTTVDPGVAPAPGQPRPTVTRLCTDLRIEPPLSGALPEVSAIVPGNSFPVPMQLFAIDATAGQSTRIENAFYRPDIALALPSQGPTTGGSLVTLIGTALVPPDLTSSTGPAPLAFGDIQLSLAKGGRITVLAPDDLRVAESGADRLVFTMPASPDGRPGQVDIVLRVKFGGVEAPITASQVFLFANPKPFFGPRGAVLDRAPVAVVPIFLDAEPGDAAVAAPDFAVLTDQGGVGFLQLLLAQQNGMFQPFAAPRQIGNHEVAAERGPSDICSGDFDGDGVPDMFLSNRGVGSAVHHVVLGRARPATPLGSVHHVAGVSAARCRSALFDGDPIADVLLLPGTEATPGQLPVVLLARPNVDGSPAFAPGIELPVRPLLYDAVEVADLDGDGHLDVALLRGETLQLDVAFGNGDGTFAAGTPLDFAIPGYTPDPRSTAVGLHACRNGPLQSLSLVLAGLSQSLPEGPQTKPAIVILPQPQARVFVGPADETSILLPLEPLGQSLVADLDGLPPVELAIALAGNPTVLSLALLHFAPSGFVPVINGIEVGAELPRQIRALHFGRAFAPTPISPEARAVFVVHESLIDGQPERRLSTRLLFSEGTSQKLLPPDAGAEVLAPIEGIVGGNFHPVSIAGHGLVRDLALSRSGTIELIENDGFGGFPRPSNKLQWAGLLPGSTRLVPAPVDAFDQLVFLAADSRLGIWRHDPTAGPNQSPDRTTMPLRAVVPNAALQAATLANTSRIRTGDVDGDGLDDLVVLLSFAGFTGEGEAAIVLLRGKAMPSGAEFPFHEPVAATLVHGNATSMALGDFAVASSGPRQLELAVTVPVGTTPGAIDGDHVRFFRYESGPTPAEDTFVPSAVAGGPQVLLAGNAPTQIVAGDFDRDGLVGLLVASAGDSSLRLLRNLALPAAGQRDVDVGSFQESLSSPLAMPAGKPTRLQLSDVNGDGNVDAVVVTEFTSAVTGVRSTSVAFYLSSGAGQFTGPQFVSPTRVGDRNAQLAADIGDWNRDGVPDLFLGWTTFGSGDRNLRVLFGGTR